MRGVEDRQQVMWSSVSVEDLIPAGHPIRRIRKVVDAVLEQLGPEFDAMYAAGGRPSVPPEQLLKSTVLMALYSTRSERQLCERLNYDLSFTWFLDLTVDAKAFDASTFSKNRARPLDHEIADQFTTAGVVGPDVALGDSARRFRRPVAQASIERDIDDIAPQEIRNAIVDTVRSTGGIAQEDLVVAVRSIFGFERTGQRIESRISRVLASARRRGELSVDTGRVVLGKPRAG